MFKPTWIIGIVIAAVVLIGGLGFTPVHNLTVHITVNGDWQYGAGVTVDDVYVNTGHDGNAVFNLLPGQYQIWATIHGQVKTATVDIGMFDLNKEITINFLE